MGALHAGHVELIRVAQRRAAVVIVTVFLNPLQFAPGEDLAKYPRTLPDDLALCAAEGVDVVFAPTVDEVYPDGEPLVRIDAGPLGDVFEGASRPGHFDGVLTVVAKLMNLTQGDVALFGQKDAQQLLLITRMVRDLDLTVEVIGVPTVRDGDGLALSSRNIYLAPTDRVSALALGRAMQAARSAVADGPDAVRRQAAAVLADEAGISVDYLALVEPTGLREVGSSYVGDALLLVAAKVGKTRLIDNAALTLLAPTSTTRGD
jgi:pantoate--beta-alanine ligase